MDYTKLPLDYPEILQLLKDRGLIIRDDNDATAQLKIMSYIQEPGIEHIQSSLSCRNHFMEIG